MDKPDTGGAESRDEDLARTARSLYNQRRRRDAVFEEHGSLFGEPNWDMMLDLFEHQSRGERTYISSLCIASQVPATTALRWINSLCRRGLLARNDDKRDLRRSSVELTPEGLATMRRYLARL